MTTLDKIPIGSSAVVVEINTQQALKQRLFDIGLVIGTQVSVIHKSPSGDPRAYLIRGAVIALRNCDAKNISVEGEGNER